MTKFGHTWDVANTRGSSVFLEGQPRPNPKGRAPAPPIFFGISYMGTLGIINSNQILHGDQTRHKENFYLVDHALLPWPMSFLTQMLTRDLLG